jgi:hypothetical protein
MIRRWTIGQVTTIAITCDGCGIHLRLHAAILDPAVKRHYCEECEARFAQDTEREHNQ